MSNLDTCGIEVSAKELVVARRQEERLEPLRSFANTAEGHQALIRYLRRAGRVVRVCLESTGLCGLDLALALSGQEGIEVMVASPRRAGGSTSGRRSLPGGRLIEPGSLALASSSRAQ